VLDVFANKVRVAHAVKRLRAPGTKGITAKFTRKAKRALGKRKKVKLIVRLTVTDAAGTKRVKTRHVTLKQR
jgi:hypothetical protein